MKRHFILGDFHISHQNIIKYSQRPFKDIEDMNNALIFNWNSVVTPSDTVYVLGDVTMNKKYLPLMNEFVGRKVLVLGNHDIFDAKTYLKYFDDVRGYIVKDNIIISHIPVHENELTRFQGNIHAHTHENRVMIASENKVIIDSRYYCVSVEQINYTPILLETAIENLKNQK